MTTDVLPANTLRALAASSLLAAAVAHLPVIPEHLREAPYMGAAFIGFSLLATLIACGLAFTGRRALHVVTIGLCAAAILTYAMTRTVAFPELSDDVGNWSERLGVISIAAEMIAMVASSLALAARPRARTTAYFAKVPAVVLSNS